MRTESHRACHDATATANSCALEVAWMALRAQGLCWIDTHCHLDAPSSTPDHEGRCWDKAWHRGMARDARGGVSQFERLPGGAHLRPPHALGIHPLEVERPASDDALQQLDEAPDPAEGKTLSGRGQGRSGWMDGWVRRPLARQRTVYEAQLKLAAKHRLPVILHVRRSADLLLAGLRRVSGVWRHRPRLQRQRAAGAGLRRARFRAGFCSTLTYERSRQIRSLLAELPAHAWVLETDAPDIPPSWLYVTAAQRAATGSPSGRNAPTSCPGSGACR